MKIIKLKAENIKKIKAVEIEPRDNTVVISGKNGQGKTSVLDSIWYTLGGVKSIPEEPIRKGENKAEVVIDLGDMIVTRKWTSNNKSYLQIVSKDGAVFPSPQKMLDKLIGDLSFDPLEFATTEKENQVKILLNAIKFPPFHERLIKISGVQIPNDDPINSSFNLAHKMVFDERTMVNRELKNLEVKKSAIQISAGAEKTIEKVNVVELCKKRDDIKKKIDNANYYITKTNLIKEKIKEMNEELLNLNDEYASAGDIVYHPKQHDPELEEIEEKIANAEETNDIAQKIEEKRIVTESLEKKTDEAEALTTKLDNIKKLKDDILSSSDMPIDGLNFSSNGVTYNDIPFNQLSSSEQLKVSLAIAMALNPQLKVIRITDGSLLDEDSLSVIKSIAEKKDYQVWIEIVDSTGKLGICIEEGEVKNEN